jgi:uncharacterized delta-60 repeat protein
LYRPTAALLSLPLLASLTAVTGQQPARVAFCSGANGEVFVIVLQKDGKILLGGRFTNLGGQPRARIGRLNADGSVDATFNPGANNLVDAIAVQPDGKVLVGGDFDQLDGQPRAHIGRLNADGSLDASFNPGATAPNNVLPVVITMTLQSDGKILVGGGFSKLAGQPRSGMGRLNADGSLDASFNLGVGGTNAGVVAMVVQPDDKIVVGGSFTTFGGRSRTNLTRLNADGSLDSGFNPGVTDDQVSALALQPDGKILAGGSFATLGDLRRGRIGRLNADGSLDTAFNTSADGFDPIVLAIALQADGKILIGGSFNKLGGQPRTQLGRLNADGSVDLVFNPGLNPGADAEVSTLAVQSDGEILVGGRFDVIDGESHNSIGRLLPDGNTNPDDCPDARLDPAVASNVSTIAVGPDGKTLVGSSFPTLGGAPGRLNADGSLDASFNPRADRVVSVIGVQPDGKILVGGEFSMLAGQARNLIGRLNEDGSLDASFNANSSFLDTGLSTGITPERESFDSVGALSIQPDGKIIIGGSFTVAGTPPRGNIGRLNADGSVDTSFTSDANAQVFVTAIQPDGKILVGGDFTRLDGQPRMHLGRLNPDGSIEAAFDPGVTGSNASVNVNAIAFQADGKILVGGLFGSLGGQSRASIGRLNADGSLDTSFDAGTGGQFARVLAMAVQADGKILVGGSFNKLGAQPRANIGRLNADGSLDSFNPGAEPGADPSAFAEVEAIALKADGQILVGGVFATLAGQPRSFFGRLPNTTPAVQSLKVNAKGSKVIWSRTGASPEVVRVTFELSTDGVNYTPLGSGKRTSKGWKLPGLTLPKDRNFFIRARGYYAGSVVEMIAGPGVSKFLRGPARPSPRMLNEREGEGGREALATFDNHHPHQGSPATGGGKTRCNATTQRFCRS